MQRQEVLVEVEMEKTPSYVEASKLVAEQFKAKEENIMIEQVKGTFGKKTFVIKASIYSTKELCEESRKRLIKPKKVAAAPAA